MEFNRQKVSQRIEGIFNESIEVKLDFLKNNKEKLLDLTQVFIQTFQAGHKVLAFGNGGSSCDAQHFVGEFVTRFMKDRRPLPAVALTADSSILTSCANDYSYEDVFSRQLEALGQKGDIAFGISTSGNSENVIRAIKAAKKKGLIAVGLTGKNGGNLGPLVDYHINVGIGKTPRIQETHIVVIHLLCEMVDNALFDHPFLAGI
jgi:D-sedoheptulose 7-phosphate isomerase